LSFTGLIPTVADQPSLGLILYLIPLGVLFFATRSMRSRLPGFIITSDPFDPPSKPKSRDGYAH
jgi:hypothetical protein